MESKKYKEIDHLTEDPILPSQRFVCISFVSPEGLRNCTLRGIKIRGVYATAEEAKARAKEISEFDADFDVFVGEIGKWLPWDPDPNTVKDAVYQEKELNNLVYQRKQSMKKAKQVQEQRKRDMLERAAREEQKRRRKQKKKKNKKKINTKTKVKKATQLQKPKKLEFKKETEEIEKEREQIKENKKLVNKEEGELSDIDKQLKQIEALYSKMKEGGTPEIEL